MPTAVCIIEDNPATRETLLKIIKATPSLTCVGVYSGGEEALRQIAAAKPDVALVDIEMPGMNGVECVRRITALLPKLLVVMLTMHEDRDMIFDSLRAGAKGYLLKKIPPAELVEAIEEVRAGGSPMSMQIARKVVEHFKRIGQPASEVELLTPREKEILELLAKGRYYKEIADGLGISISTVKGHLGHIYEKLHVQTRTEATRKFLNRG